jgi:hypothetical protein
VAGFENAVADFDFWTLLTRLNAMGNLPIYIFVVGWAIQFFVAAYFWMSVLTNFAPGIGWRDVLLLQNLSRTSFFDLAPTFFNEEGQKYRERLIRISPRLRTCLFLWIFVAGPILILIQAIYNPS